MKHIRSVRIGCDGGVCPPSLVAPHQPWKLQLLRHFFQTKQRNFAKLNSKELFLFLHFGYLKTSESHPSAPFHIFHICFLCVAPSRITVPAHCSATSRLMIFSQDTNGTNTARKARKNHTKNISPAKAKDVHGHFAEHSMQPWLICGSTDLVSTSHRRNGQFELALAIQKGPKAANVYLPTLHLHHGPRYIYA